MRCALDAPGKRVTETEVVKHWLAVEREKTGADADDLDTLSHRAALDELLRYKPGAAAFLWRDRPIEWSQTTLSRTEFERLRLIDGPEGLLWDALSPDGTVMGAARRVERVDTAALASETGIDVGRILDVADALADGSVSPLVLTKRRGRGPPRVADGNHRAVAIALRLLRTAEYRPQMAYLGIGANPIARPLARRVLGVFDRLCRTVGDGDCPRW
jgi:hypothetical protein